MNYIGFGDRQNYIEFHFSRWSLIIRKNGEIPSLDRKEIKSLISYLEENVETLSQPGGQS